jgi:hypothetical protein
MIKKLLVPAGIFLFLFAVSVVPRAQALTTLNGQNGATQNFATTTNNQNVRITSASNVHSIDWVGVLQPVRGGTGASSFATGSVTFFRNGKFSEDNANLYWDDTNNRLGIGTTTPAQALHLYSSVAAPYLRIQGASDGDNYSGLELWDTSSNRWQIVNSAANDHNLVIVGNNLGGGYQFPLAINASTDYVGVNNLQSPTANLSVNGSFAVAAGNTATTSIYTFNNNGDDLLNIQRSGAERGE